MWSMRRDGNDCRNPVNRENGRSQGSPLGVRSSGWWTSEVLTGENDLFHSIDMVSWAIHKGEVLG